VKQYMRLQLARDADEDYEEKRTKVVIMAACAVFFLCRYVVYKFS
jgi:hypothetical protein